MNRCLRFLIHLSSGIGILLLAPTSALAQAANPWAAFQRIPPIARDALPGVLRITAPPEALLNGQPARLAPGARIRDQRNLIVMSAALVDLNYAVLYALDPQGLIRDVWILTESEIQAFQPPPPPQPNY